MKTPYFLQNMPFGIQINPISRDKFIEAHWHLKTALRFLNITVTQKLDNSELKFRGLMSKGVLYGKKKILYGHAGNRTGIWNDGCWLW